jgi:hypothetical protein
MTTVGGAIREARDSEVLLTDERVGRIQSRVSLAYPILRDSDFVTWVQEARLVETEHGMREIEEMANFAIVTPLPHNPKLLSMTHATCSLRDWEESDQVWKNDTDPAMMIFLQIAPSVVANLRNSAELIH